MPDAAERITLTSTGIQVDGVTLPGTLSAGAIAGPVDGSGEPPLYAVAVAFLTVHEPVIGPGVEYDPNTGIATTSAFSRRVTR